MKIACPTCQARIKVGEKHLGKKVKCPKCEGVFRIPKSSPKVVNKEPEIVVTPKTIPAKKAKIICPQCDNGFKIPADWLGELVTCSGCRTVIKTDPRTLDPVSEIQTSDMGLSGPEDLVSLNQADDWLSAAELQRVQLQPRKKQLANSNGTGRDARSGKEKPKSVKKYRLPLWGACIALGSLILIGIVAIILFALTSNDDIENVAMSGQPAIESKSQSKKRPASNPKIENPKIENPKIENPTTEIPKTEKQTKPKQDGGIRALPTQPAESETKARTPKNPDSDAPAPPKRLLSYGPRAGEHFGYHHEFEIGTKHRGKRLESKVEYDAVYNLASQDVTGESPAPLQSTGTGLGIPGNRIVVCNQLIQDATAIRIIKDGQVHNARIIKALPGTPLSLLQVESQLGFSPPRLMRHDELGRSTRLIHFDELGRLETYRNRYQASLRTSHWGQNNQFNDWGWMHRVSFTNEIQVGFLRENNWMSAISYDHRGRVTGFVVINQEEKNRPEVFPASGLAHAMLNEPDTFDLTTSTKSPMVKDIEDELKPNLVQVAVDRKLRPRGVHELGFDFQIPPKRPGLPQRRLPVETDLNRLNLNTVNIDPKLSRFSGSIKLHESNPNGAEVKFSSRWKRSWHHLPGLLGQAALLPFLDLGEQSKSWTVTKKIQVVQIPGGCLAIQEFVEKDREKTLGGIQTEKYDILEINEDSAKIKRRIQIEASSSENTRTGLDKHGPVSMTADQIIEFDIRAGMVKSSKLKGQLDINPAANQLSLFNFKLDTKAMSSDKVKSFIARRSPQYRTLQHWESENGRPMYAYVQTKKTRLEPTNSSAIPTDTLTRILRDLVPVQNEEISLNLANFGLFKEVGSYEQVAPLWILEKHVPLLLEQELMLKKHQSGWTSVVLQILERYPKKDRVEEILADSIHGDLTVTATIRLLKTTYSEFSEQLILPIIEKAILDNSKTRNRSLYGLRDPRYFRMFWCLRETGTSASVPVLKTFRDTLELDSKISNSPNKTRMLESIDKTIDIIEKRESE